MNISSKLLIELSAPFLATSDARKYRQYLRSPLSTAIGILEVIESSDVPVTIDHIADTTGISITVVRDTIAAMRKGGYPLNVIVAGTSGGKYLISPTGNEKSSS